VAINCIISLPNLPVSSGLATDRNGRFITREELVNGNALIALWSHLGFVSFEEVPDPPFDPWSVFGPAFGENQPVSDNSASRFLEDE
jgi:hypothetical protein